jgi:hypothetical protein
MIDYLLIGHVSTDLTPAGPKPGGAVTFASHVAHVLGYKTAVLTSAAPDYDLTEAFSPAVEVISLPSEETTVFENVYTPDGNRQQTLHSQARQITAADVPAAWRNAKIVHLAPIDEEIDVDVARIFPDSIIGVTPQGWLRGWDEEGHVFPQRAPFTKEILPLISAIVVSEEDMVSHDQI